MTMAEICEAAITLSDNTAGNLQLASIGGPEGLTAFVRSLGDNITRLDRWETILNEATPGDPRDTTTPTAMLDNMHKILLGNVLSKPSRQQLVDWLIANKTSGKRFRAHLPTGWRLGDKTGTGDNGATNDIGIIWPPGRQPILVAGYYAGSHASDDQRNAILAEVARIAAAI
jgi:beta-lactamase class A